LNELARLSWTDVRDRIRARILDRTYAPGDKLPKDEDLAQSFGCARATVHRAMQDLVSAGLIERKRKGGTRVLADPVTRATFDIPITRVEVESRGSKYDYRLLDRTIEEVPATVLARFGMRQRVQMLRVRALHLADNRPYIYEDRWIDQISSPEVLDLDLTRESANEWLVRNKPYSRLDVRFLAENAKDARAFHLDVPEGSALLVIERTTWNGDMPITTVHAVCSPGYQVAARS